MVLIVREPHDYMEVAGLIDVKKIFRKASEQGGKAVGAHAEMFPECARPYEREFLQGPKPR